LYAHYILGSFLKICGLPVAPIALVDQPPFIRMQASGRKARAIVDLKLLNLKCGDQDAPTYHGEKLYIVVDFSRKGGTFIGLRCRTEILFRRYRRCARGHEKLCRFADDQRKVSLFPQFPLYGKKSRRKMNLKYFNYNSL